MSIPSSFAMSRNSNDVTQLLDTTDDSTFGEKDWNIVIIECQSLANTWEKLSGYLGLSYKEINKIKTNHDGDCASCWNEALEQWISQNYNTEWFGRPSWRSLLKSVALVDQRLCKELAAQHQIKALSKHTILQKLDEFKNDQKHEIHDAIEKVKTSSEDIETKIGSIVREINDTFHELQQILDLHKQRLLKEASQIQEEKLKRLVQQKNELEKRVSVILDRVTTSKRVVEEASGENLEAIQDKMSSWMEKEKCKKLNLDPVEEADTKFEVKDHTQELSQMCKTIKIVTNHVDPLKCTIERFEEVKVVEINVPFVVILNVASMSGRPQLKLVDIDAKLRSCVDQSLIIHAITKQNQGNIYTIECTPHIRDQCFLDVTVNGLEVLGSPFCLFVRIPPAQLGNPLKIINGLKGPTGLAFNSVGELIVAEFNGGVVILDKDGQEVRCIERHGKNYNFEHPWGVAVDVDDNIYVTDQDNKRIYKFNKDLELVNHNVVKENKCFGVVVIGEQVVVMEKMSNKLEIFTRDLAFVRVVDIGCRGCSLAFDKRDARLYVCDSITHRVKVFAVQCDQFEYLHSIGNKPDLGLRIPHFICTDSNLVYVTEYDAHCVSIFTKEGKYVTSFGEMGSSKGQFDHPYGIVQDFNGFLYVSDRVNDRLQVF